MDFIYDIIKKEENQKKNNRPVLQKCQLVEVLNHIHGQGEYIFMQNKSSMHSN